MSWFMPIKSHRLVTWPEMTSLYSLCCSFLNCYDSHGNKCENVFRNYG